jgi:hypothetical protein
MADVEADPSTVDSTSAAEAAFDELLSSPGVCSLISVDQETNRLFMHRSTQLQVIVLAQTKLKSSQQARRGTGQSALNASLLRAAPTPLQQWQSSLTLETLAAFQRVWPAREEDVPSLFALESIAPTVVRLVVKSAALPMAHESNAKLLAELFKQTQLLQSSYRERELYAEMQLLAAAMQKITLPSSEVHQWQILWDAVALSDLGEETKSIKQLQSLLDTLRRDDASAPNGRLELRAQILLQLADAHVDENPSLALSHAESSLSLLRQWQGEHARTVETAHIWCMMATVHLARDARDLAQECARKALDAAEHSCGHKSVQAARAHMQLANISITQRAILKHRRTALDIFDSTVGMGQTSSAAVVASLALGQKLGSEECPRFFITRRNLLLEKLGEYHMAIGLLGRCVAMGRRRISHADSTARTVRCAHRGTGGTGGRAVVSARRRGRQGR